MAQVQRGRDIKGTVLDSTKTALPGTTVELLSNDGDSLRTLTIAGGSFVFHNIGGTKITVTISFAGFQTTRMHYSLGKDTSAILLPPIFYPPWLIP